MTKKLTILLLFASLSGLSQTRKSDWVVSPQVSVFVLGFNYLSNDSAKYRSFSIDIPVHYYLSNKLSFGLNIPIQYSSNSRSNGFYNNDFSIGIRPEIQYNFSKTRFTPFIRISPDIFFDFSLYKYYIPNPYLYNNKGYGIDIQSAINLKSSKIDIGLNYFVKERLGVFGLVTFGVDFVNPQIYRYGYRALFNIGCQYIFSRRKQQEQKLSPRAF